MKKKLLVVTFLLISSLFIACSSDESKSDNPKPVVTVPSAITVTNLSSEFIVKGESLEITGTNFTNKDYPTKIFINETEVTAKELTDTKFLLSDLKGIKAGTNSLTIQIDKIKSSPISFFVIEKGWNKLTTLGDLDINTSSIIDNNYNVYSFYGENYPIKLQTSSSGYSKASIPSLAIGGAFKMFDDKKGVSTNTTQIIYSNDGFKTNKVINVGSNFNMIINGLRIGYLDENTTIINNQIAAQVYLADNGTTVIKNESPSWAKIDRPGGGITTRASISGFGKSASNGKFYQIGKIYDQKKYGSIIKNIVLESETGYSNWTVLDSISNGNQDYSVYKFVDINKIVMTNITKETLEISTDMMKTWSIIKTNVSRAFLRTSTQWYIQSGDKILVTKDSGINWELELELPSGSVVNDISFSKNKIILSGKKGLHYLKVE
ncbi:hypothetical protein [Flavobacterium sp. N502540]|uniref:hypothetical protein n=1 Tax=Flavobacterium sp. N502540 TaxID=2986838 RepID=UPI002224C68C|nr:hypothetical protein [Flavobacterium sp. N502540]